MRIDLPLDKKTVENQDYGRAGLLAEKPHFWLGLVSVTHLVPRYDIVHCIIYNCVRINTC